MEYIGSIQAALKATAPVVAIPVEGRAPICVRRKLLAGALKGVTITSVEIVNGWLCIQGRAGELTRTSCKIRAIARHDAIRELAEWTDREIAKRRKIALQGVLSASEQRALKLKKAEQVGIAELKAAQLAEAQIIAEAKLHARNELRPIAPKDREDLMESYLAFYRGNRKIGSTILYKMGKLQKELDALTVRKTVQPRRRGRYRPPVEHINRVRRPKNIALVADLMAQIGALKAEFQALYPPVWEAPRSEYEWDRGRWKESFVKQRPRGGWKDHQAYWFDRWGHEDHYDRKELARRLRNARADIRALSPPETEEDMPIAA